jgi:RimJ/RimL family protein N-acetyltransferase
VGVGELGAITDGIVAIRRPLDGDTERLIAGRDQQFHRFLGEGSEDPAPAGCIVVDGDVVGWVDFDVDRSWLKEGEVNLGYNVFAEHRGNGYGTRAVKLLLHHMAVTGAASVATLLIHPDNDASLALAERAGFSLHGELDGNPYWKKPVPPLTYSDGVVTIRRRQLADLDPDLEAKDDEQIRWLWLPWQRQAWADMTDEQRRRHAAEVLRENHETFGSGPKWTFTVDTRNVRGVAYVDCDLANDHVPSGEANISYASHPDYRGKGYVSRSVHLVLEFLRDHTGVRTADIITDDRNTPSLRVARALGAEAVEHWTTDDGHTMIRHRVDVHGPQANTDQAASTRSRRSTYIAAGPASPGSFESSRPVHRRS